MLANALRNNRLAKTCLALHLSPEDVINMLPRHPFGKATFRSRHRPSDPSDAFRPLEHPVTLMNSRGASLAALAALLLAACGGDEGPEPADVGPLPPGTQAIEASARLPEPAVTSRCYSPPGRTVFHSAEEWATYWQGTNATCPPPPVPGGVDFSREMLVFASIGKRMNPQDKISIDAAGVRNDSLIIVVRRTTLQDGCPEGQTPTFPMSLVKLPTDSVPVRFSEAHVKVPCEPAQ